MKKFLFVVAGILATGTANAWTYTYSTNVANGSVPGEVCASNGYYKIVRCECGQQTPQNPKGVSESCVLNGESNSTIGCKLQERDGVVAYCMFDAGVNSDICANYCGCDSIYGSWSSISSNRVSRPVTAMNKGSYRCSEGDITTQYGCAANYYTTATSPSASMTCSPCPSSGKSAIGNIAITGCYIPANTILKDVAGSYKFTSDCYYSK